jgi:membrane dipeptidase
MERLSHAGLKRRTPAKGSPYLKLFQKDETDRSSDRDPFAVQRSTLVVNGLDVSTLNKKYLRMLKAGGVNCWHKSMGGLESFAYMYDLLDNLDGEIVVAKSVRDIHQAHKNGKMSLVFGWQSAESLVSSQFNPLASPPVYALRAYYELGLRVVGISYNVANVFGGGCLKPDIGLTRAGQKLVEEIHKQGIVLDVGGHTSEKCSFEALAISKGVPIICSHTNVAALNNNARCMSDRLIEAIAETGGVIGLTAFNDFHARTAKDAHIARTPQVGLEKHLDQYDYIRKLVGVDHVGLGPDFVEGRGLQPPLNREVLPAEVYSDLPWLYVKGYENISELPNLTRGLIQRGWSTKEIHKMLGENWLRVYSQVWGA